MVSVLYADSSALVRAYFEDEPDHADLRTMLLEGSEPVVTSAIAHLELTAAVSGAARAGRLRRREPLLGQIDLDMTPGGKVKLIALRPEVIFPIARRLLVEHRLRTLDAIHLGVLLEDCPALADPSDTVLVTRDDDQAAAATALGFAVR